MRKLLLPFLLVLLALPALAQGSVLTLRAERGEVFYVKLNGRTINHAASNFVRVAPLRPGRHYVEFKVRSRHGVYRMGQHVYVPEGVEANYGVRTAGRSGKAYLRLLSELPLLPPPPVVRPAPYEPAPPRYDDRHCRNLLTSRELDRVVQAISSSRASERTRFSIAREAVRSGGILADDLKRLLQQFEYEDTRVEFAKFAYGYLCDPEHFYYIYDLFRYDSSVQELERYSRGRR